MKKCLVPLLVAMAGALLLAGCSTPSSRIKKNPALFNSLPPEVQANVQQGRIEVGYSADAVRLALGPPRREFTRKTATGIVKVWAYTSEYTTTDRQRVNARVSGRDSSGTLRTFTDWVWVDVEQRHEYDRMRVELEDDKVTAIETLER